MDSVKKNDQNLVEDMNVRYHKYIACQRIRGKFFLLTCNLITMQNLVVLSHIMCVHIRCPGNFGYAGGMPPRDEGMVDPL